MRRFLDDSSLCTLLAAILAVAGPWVSVCVHASSNQPLAEIQRAAESAVQRDVRVTNGTLFARAVELDSRLALVACTQSLQARSAPIRAGMTRALVAVTCSAPVAWTVNVPVTLDVEQDVLIVRQPIARGATLAANDVAIERRRLPGVSTRFVASPTDLAQKVARRPLAAGEPLTADALAPAVIVKRGQVVTLVSQVGAVTIRSGGRAMGDAAMQGRVRVQNESSRKVIEGIVESADTVRVGR